MSVNTVEGHPSGSAAADLSEPEGGGELAMLQYPLAYMNSNTANVNGKTPTATSSGQSQFPFGHD